MGKKPYRTPINWDSIFSGYFSSVSALIRTGNHVIADCPVYNQKLASLFAEHIAPIPNIVVVKVDCPFDILEQREKLRNDRSIGIARKQFNEIHSYLTYNLQVETDKLMPTASAKTIFDYLGSL